MTLYWPDYKAVRVAYADNLHVPATLVDNPITRAVTDALHAMNLLIRVTRLEIDEGTVDVWHFPSWFPFDHHALVFYFDGNCWIRGPGKELLLIHRSWPLLELIGDNS